ncbi:MAG TPA: deoxyribodipyrimidine photo-lyase [Polyangiaceae bacterium]|nr:deoxyribodipyrimidine photo-lyase [Polyangiaceae bacterium]
MKTLVWFRGKDLRVGDQPALSAARKDALVVPFFVLSPKVVSTERAARSPHRTRFLLDSVGALAKNLERRSSRLVLGRGAETDAVLSAASRFGVDRVVTLRRVEPFAREQDRVLRAALGERYETLEGETLLPPDALRTGSGTPYTVFTPFARAFRAREHEVGEPLPAPTSLPPVPRELESAELPTPGSLGLPEASSTLPGGERAARTRLARFIETRARDYADARDRLDRDGTSRLSQDLAFGTVSITTVYRAARLAAAVPDRARSAFTNELLWREFTHATLHARPELVREPFRAEFRDFPWEADEKGFEAWRQGMTGYPVVDAAQRELLADGFVPNRARMITVSFLSKHLLVDYRRGEAHYLDLLTDADVAQNNAGFQWSAGTGADAEPYFRVFNPTLQGEKFDPEGSYVKRWVPELADLPKRFIHRPWEAPEPVLRDARVTLGKTYPRPIVDHAEARTRFLALASSLRAAE